MRQIPSGKNSKRLVGKCSVEKRMDGLEIEFMNNIAYIVNDRKIKKKSKNLI